MINIGLCGLGKAGTEFVNYIEHSGKCHDFVLTDVLCRDSSSTAKKIVTDITGIVTAKNLIINNLSDFRNNNQTQVIVDFSASQTSKELVDLCCKEKINLVICTTNFSDNEIEAIKQKVIESGIGVVFAPTLTIGINLLMDFVSRFSHTFPDFSFEIIEKHAKNKGFPTKTAQIISSKIDKEDTKISSIRLNGYVGVHEVIATDGFEKISIEHESFSRAAFVRGALFAARYITNKKGFYLMNDIVNDTLKANEIISNVD